MKTLIARKFYVIMYRVKVFQYVEGRLTDVIFAAAIVSLMAISTHILFLIDQAIRLSAHRVTTAFPPGKCANFINQPSGSKG